MGYLGHRKGINDILPLLILIFCLCGDGGFDDILGDFDEWLPWLIILLCCCNR